MAMRRLRDILNTSKKMAVSAVCVAEILLIPCGLAACTANNSSVAEQITLEKAEEIALADAKVTASDITSIKSKPDTSNNVFDIEFYADDVKYEYEITADTGDIYSRSKEILTSQENVPNETKQDMSLAEETQSDTTPAPSESRQDTTQQDTTEQNTTQSGSVQQNTTQSGSVRQNTTQSGSVQQNAAQPGTTTQSGSAQQNATLPNETQQNTSQPTPNSKGQISLDDAKKAALADAGLSSSDVTYTKEKLDYEDGIAVYEIEFYTSTMEYEYEIHATTGAVYSKDVETHHTGTGHGIHTQASGTYIGDDSARSIALNHAGFSASDVTRLKSEFDIDDGQAVYEVEFYKDGREYDYEINASDGTILKYEVD